MGLQLQLQERLSTDIKRVAEEQALTALEELGTVQRQTDDYDQFARVLDKSVHNARKALKKIRAVLRLVRDELGEEAYQRENLSYRNAGRLLSGLRDQYVMVQTIDELREDHAGEIAADTVAAVQSALAAQHEARRKRLFADSKPIQRAIIQIELARQRISAWPIEQDGYVAVRKGLRRTYKRGRKRMRDAYADPAPEHFHEWRKRVKYHWYHMRMLTPLWPTVLSKIAEDIHEAADYLGDAHDIAELQKTLKRLQDVGDKGEIEALFSLLSQRRQSLENAAKPLGARIFVESPDRFVRRIGGYWEVAAELTAGSAPSPHAHNTTADHEFKEDGQIEDIQKGRQAVEHTPKKYDLTGKKVAILVEDGFEQEELSRPQEALEEFGAETEIISPQQDEVKGWNHGVWGDSFPVDVTIDNANAGDYDALLLPGGVMNPDKLRTNSQAVDFVRAFFEAHKPVAAICHGPWTLIEAGVAEGRTMTSYHSIQTDLKNAGADWVDQEVVVDNGLVTSRNPGDLPAFNTKMIAEIAESKHEQQQA